MSGFADEVTPVILTRDEEPNIERTLRQLQWAGEVVVCDSGSTDATLRIARGFPNVRVFPRSLDTLADQWTAATAQARTEWVLTLDADYFVPEALIAEIAALRPEAKTGGYEASFTYAVGGKPLRASLYPPRAVLLRRGAYAFFMDGHTQRVRVTGVVAPLRTRIVHDDRKSLARFIARQRRYMRDEAAKLRAAPPGTLNAAARLRKLRVLAPFVIPFYTLFAKGLIRDGWTGLHYTFERTLAELILSIELFRRTKRTP
jgi:glycosyltransferase involved in cell wall biosynthesis